MIMLGITRFTDMKKGFFGTYVVAAAMALFIVALMSLALLPCTAFADEPSNTVEKSSEAPAFEAAESVDQGEEVYVYLHLTDDAAIAAEKLGLQVNGDGSNKWFTIGVIRLDIDKASEAEKTSILLADAENAGEDIDALKESINQALKSIVRYPANEALAIYGAQWKELKVCDGATDYHDGSLEKTWHLDGELSVQLVKFDVNYIDAGTGKPLTVGSDADSQESSLSHTIFVAEGSEIAASDYVIDVPGYRYSESKTQEANDGNLILKAEGASSMTLVYEKATPPDNEEEKPPVSPGESRPGDKPGSSSDGNGGGKTSDVIPGVDETSMPKLPNISFSMPKATERPRGSESASVAMDDARGGFAATEKTTVSEPLAFSGAAEGSSKAAAAETDDSEVVISDDEVPMVTRASEAIPEENVPMGAFDAPVDPAPWVAGLGALTTAFWGILAVSRRLLMAQRLASFEAQVLGVVPEAAEAEVAVAASASH